MAGLVERKSPEDLRLFAERCVNKEIYITNTEEGINASFGAILHLAAKHWEDELHLVGGVYEEMSKAGGHSVNGRPMFLSCQFLHIDDVDELERLVKEMSATKEVT